MADEDPFGSISLALPEDVSELPADTDVSGLAGTDSFSGVEAVSDLDQSPESNLGGGSLNRPLLSPTDAINLDDVPDEVVSQGEPPQTLSFDEANTPETPSNDSPPETISFEDAGSGGDELEESVDLAALADEKFAAKEHMPKYMFKARRERDNAKGVVEKSGDFVKGFHAGGVGIGESVATGLIGLIDAQDKFGLIDKVSEALFGVQISAAARKDVNKRTGTVEAAASLAEGVPRWLNQSYEIAKDGADWVARTEHKMKHGDEHLLDLEYAQYSDSVDRHWDITAREGESVLGSAASSAAGFAGMDAEQQVKIQNDVTDALNPAIVESAPLLLDAALPGFGAGKVVGSLRKNPSILGRGIVRSSTPPPIPGTAAARQAAKKGPGVGAKAKVMAGNTAYTLAKKSDAVLSKTLEAAKNTAKKAAPIGVGGGAVLATQGNLELSDVLYPALAYGGLRGLQFSGKVARGAAAPLANATKLKTEMIASGVQGSAWKTLAADKTKPAWTRAVAKEVDHMINTQRGRIIAATTAGAVTEAAEEALQTAVQAGANVEDIGEGAGGGFVGGTAFGLAGGIAGARNLDNHLADRDAVAFRQAAEARGDNPAVFDNLSAQTRRDVAAVQGTVGASANVRLLSDNDYEKAVGNRITDGAFTIDNEILVRAEGVSEANLLKTLSHEAGHAAYKALPAELKSEWKDMLETVYSREDLDAFRSVYQGETGVALTDQALADEIFAEQFLGYGSTGKALLKNKKELDGAGVSVRRKLRNLKKGALRRLGIEGGETTRSGDLLEYTPYADSPEVEAFINDSLKELGKPLPKTELPKPKKKKRKPGRPKGSKNKKKKSKDSTDARPQTSEDTTPVTDGPIDVPEVDGVTEPVGPAVPDISDQTSEAILKAIDPATPLEVGTLPNGKSVIPVADMGKHIEYIDGDELATEIGNIDQEIHSPEQALEFAKARAQERDQNRAERGMGHYWASWSDVRDYMVKELGYSRKEADAERKKIQAEVLGEEISSKDLANDPERRKAVIAAFQERSGKTEASQEELDAMSPTERYEYDVDRALERVTKKAEPSQLDGWTQGDALPVNEDSYAKDTVHVDEFGQKYSPVRKDIEAAAIAYVEQNYDSLKEQYVKENTEGQTLTINTDEWRGMLPGYNGWNAGDVHKAASKANKRLFTEALTEQQGKANNRILFLGGGGGSGKGSVGNLTRQGEYAIVFDGVNGDRKNLLERVQRAKDAGFGADFAFVHNPPEKAAAQSIGRARHLAEAGKPPRVVPAKILIGDNYDAADVARSLIDEDLPATGFDGIMIVDNSGALGEGRVVEGPEAQAVLSRDPSQRDSLIHDLNEQLNELQSKITDLPGSERSGETRGSDPGNQGEVPGSNIDLGEGPGDGTGQVQPGDLGGDSPGGGLRLGQVGGGLGRRDTPEGVLGDSVAFTPRREFRQAAESLVGFIRENQEGFSTRLDGVVPTSGYMVAPDKGTEFFITSENLTPESLTDYLDQHAEIFERDGAHLGGWFDTDTGRYVLDASFRFDNQADAETLAVKGDQDGIFDLNTYNTIRTKDTDGRPTTTDGRNPADILQDPLDVLAFAEETARREQEGLGGEGGGTIISSTAGNLGEGGDASLGSGQLDAGRNRSLGTGSEGGDAATSRGPDPRSPEFLTGKPVAGRAPALIESNIAAAEGLRTQVAGLETGITGTRVPLRGVHWSKAANPGSLDPNVGGGAPGAEGRRQQNNPALFPNRTYFGDDGYAASPEGLVTSQAKSRSDFEVDRDKLWEPGDAPEIVAAARALAADVEGPNSPDATTYIEAALQQAGYEGMYIPSQNMGVLFNEHDLTPAATSTDVSPGVRTDGGILFSARRGEGEISASLPTAKKPLVFPEDAPVEAGRVSIERINYAAETLKDKSAIASAGKLRGLIQRVAGFGDLKSDGTVKGDIGALREARDRMVTNLLAVHDAVAPPIREHWRRWYPLAKKWNTEQGTRLGLPHWVIAGVNSRLSPGKDWIHNVNMTERIVGVMKEDPVLDDVVRKRAIEILKAADPDGKKGDPAVNFDEMFGDVQGKKFSEMSDLQAGLFARYHTQAKGDNRVINYFHPEQGVYAKNISWQSGVNLQKAVNILRTPTLENMSAQLGDAHKIRSFTNNQINPEEAVYQDVTMDTHAAGAAFILPVAQKSPEVGANFGGHTNAALGSKGTYPVLADAYRIAAERRGITPASMQSITWEGVRNLYPPRFKTKKNLDAVRKLWQQTETGEKSQAEVIREINQMVQDFLSRNPQGKGHYPMVLRPPTE